MRNSPRLFIPQLDWIVFFATVGLSLTLLFFSDHAAVSGVKREIGGWMTTLTKPLVQLRRIFVVFHENNELRQTAMTLSEENSRLRDAALENARLRAVIEFKERIPYPLLAASVVAYPGNAIGGTLVIDRGREDGVKLNSAVMTPRGLVGKVIELASNTAIVQTLVGNTYGVSVVIERSRAMGILKWIESGQWTIEGLATGEDVVAGDLVLTTGFGSVFPPSIRVGVVKEILPQSRPGSGFTRIEPFTRFDSIEELFVVVKPAQHESQEQDSIVSIKAEQ